MAKRLVRSHLKSSAANGATRKRYWKQTLSTTEECQGGVWFHPSGCDLINHLPSQKWACLLVATSCYTDCIAAVVFAQGGVGADSKI
jgi:hypothetical protein